MFYEFSFLLLRKRENITKSHKASQTSVTSCMNWDGCCRLQSPGKAKGWGPHPACTVGGRPSRCTFCLCPWFLPK